MQRFRAQTVGQFLQLMLPPAKLTRKPDNAPSQSDTDRYDRLLVRDVTQAIYVFVRMPVIFGITLLIHLTPARKMPIKCI